MAGLLASISKALKGVAAKVPSSPPAPRPRAEAEQSAATPDAGADPELQPAAADELNQRGNALRQLGRYEEALANYDRALALRADYDAARYNRGSVLLELKRPDEALACLDQVLDRNPNDAEALSVRGNTLRDLGRLEEALASYERALAVEPAAVPTLVNRGNVLMELDRREEAVMSYDRALARAPDNVGAVLGRGDALLELKHPEAALASYERALGMRPNDILTQYRLANVLLGLNRPEEALAAYNQALAIAPPVAGGLNNRGNALRQLRRYDEALASYERALALDPSYAEAALNRGNVLHDLQRPQEALASYERALALRPDDVGALFNRGNVLQALKQLEEALASYDRALQLAPNHTQALCNRGNVLLALQRPQEALGSYERVLALEPEDAHALFNRANALIALDRDDEALASYGRALARRPDFAEALLNRGAFLMHLGRYQDASDDLARAADLAPDLPYATMMLLHARMRCCEWQSFDAACKGIIDGVRDGKRSAEPWSLLSVSGSAEDQLTCAQTYVRDRCAPSARPLWQGERYGHRRIRLAYVSSDFREHAVAHLMVGLFERHDRERFETTAIAFGPDDASDMRARLKRAFNRFVDVGERNDRDVALLLRELEIDIAVDLNGHTTHARTGLFALRPAPVQVNYIGYPGTMGADYIDYIFADSFVIPTGREHCYAEKVVYIPDTFQANDTGRQVPERVPLRTEVGLPADGMLFCSFNNTYKITPAMFDVWMRLLARLEGSVLWLLGSNVAVEANLRREAIARGVEPSRLVFAPRLRYADYLARYQVADLFLDTLPFNGGTTASDALWAGLPVLTCAGDAFAARMAGSLLQAIGVPELITRSISEYEALALRLASDKTLLAAIKEKLRRNRDTHPLFDTDRFRRHIEAAYVTMWERCQRGERPASFAVPAMATAAARGPAR